MERPIPLYTVLLLMVSAALFTVLLSFGVLNAVKSPGKPGAWSRFAVGVANFPFLVGDAATELADRLSGREGYTHLSVPRPETGLAGYRGLETADRSVPRFLVRGDPARAPRGWRLFGGAFMLEEGVRHGAVLLDPDFTIRNVWTIHEDGLETDAAESARKLLHGLVMLPDGSLVATFDSGASIQRIDRCGTRLWAQSGEYHHAVGHDADTGTLWALRRDELEDGGRRDVFVALDAGSGAIRREFGLAEIAAANPDLGLLQIGGVDFAETNTNTRAPFYQVSGDPYHFNDIDPLPAARADAFPMFEAGDLAISARTLNAVFVLDPDTLEVKWHRAGATLAQHDPDWRADGRISVYDNRPGRESSRIVAFDPASFAQEVTLDGRSAGFYSRIRGKHQYGPDGTLMITSPQQGRAFEADAGGEVLLDYANLGPEGTGRNLVLTEMLWFPEPALTLKEATCSDR